MLLSRYKVIQNDNFITKKKTVLSLKEQPNHNSAGDKKLDVARSGAMQSAILSSGIQILINIVYAS